jgi:hypothetical protein
MSILQLHYSEFGDEQLTRRLQVHLQAKGFSPRNVRIEVRHGVVYLHLQRQPLSELRRIEAVVRRVAGVLGVRFQGEQMIERSKRWSAPISARAGEQGLKLYIPAARARILS